MAHSVKVVFRADVRGIARAGDVKTVSPGYARNYLFPRNLAFPATPPALRQWETERQGTLAKAERLRADSQVVAEDLSALTLSITVKASSEGRLVWIRQPPGSSRRWNALAKQGITLDKQSRSIMPQPIKKVGSSLVKLHLDAGVESTLKVEVIAEASKDTLAHTA